MTDALRPVEAKTRLYEQVLDRLRNYAVEGGLGAGDRLPPSVIWLPGWASVVPP